VDLRGIEPLTSPVREELQGSDGEEQ
jgi:hypothetical protein